MESCLTHALLESFAGRVRCPSAVAAGRFVQQEQGAGWCEHAACPTRGRPPWLTSELHEDVAHDIAPQPRFIHTVSAWFSFIWLSPMPILLKKKCYVYLKTFNSYVKTCYVFFWIHIKIHNYQSKQKMLVTITMNILFSHRYLEVLGTKITGMMPVEHTVWYDERSKTWQILGGMHVTPTCRFLF